MFVLNSMPRHQVSAYTADSNTLFVSTTSLNTTTSLRRGSASAGTGDLSTVTVQQRWTVHALVLGIAALVALQVPGG